MESIYRVIAFELDTQAHESVSTDLHLLSTFSGTKRDIDSVGSTIMDIRIQESSVLNGPYGTVQNLD